MHAFWEMAGHGPYVWSAYAIFCGVITVLALQTKLQKKRIEKKIKLAALRDM